MRMHGRQYDARPSRRDVAGGKSVSGLSSPQSPQIFISGPVSSRLAISLTPFLHVTPYELLRVGLEHVVDFVQQIVDFVGQFADAVLDVAALFDRDLVDLFLGAGGLLLPTAAVLRRHD